MNLYQEEECHRSCKLVWSEKPHLSTHPSMIDIRDTDSVAEGTNGGKCNWIVAVSNCDRGHPHTFLDSLATALLPAEPNEQCNEVLSGVCLHLNSKGNAQCLCISCLSVQCHMYGHSSFVLEPTMHWQRIPEYVLRLPAAVWQRLGC